MSHGTLHYFITSRFNVDKQQGGEKKRITYEMDIVTPDRFIVGMKIKNGTSVGEWAFTKYLKAFFTV